MKTFPNPALQGGKVVGKFSESDDVLTFTVDIPANGSYDLIFNSMGYGGDKTNKVSIDGEYVGTGRVLYIRPGIYQLEAKAQDLIISNGQNYRCTYEYVATVNIANPTVDVKVVRNETSRAIGLGQ